MRNDKSAWQRQSAKSPPLRRVTPDSRKWIHAGHKLWDLSVRAVHRRIPPFKRYSRRPACTVGMTFRVVLEHDPETDDYSAVCPELPGCASDGETEEEARANIREALTVSGARRFRTARECQAGRGDGWVIAARRASAPIRSGDQYPAASRLSVGWAVREPSEMAESGYCEAGH